MHSDLLKRMRDALETASGQYGPITDAERNEWIALVLEYDAEPAWFVTSTVPDTEGPQESEE